MPRSVMIFWAAGDVPLGIASSTSLAVAALRSALERRWVSSEPAPIGRVVAVFSVSLPVGDEIPCSALELASMVASSAPTLTVAPSLTEISASTPEAGAGTSSVTLSVSSSTSGSSAITASPTFLNQCPTVASVTDSPSVGTRISVAMPLRPVSQPYCANASSRNALSCARCLAMRPVAVDAAAARPT